MKWLTEIIHDWRFRDLAGRDGLVAAIIVKAALRLAAKPASFDIFHQKRAGAILGIRQAIIQHLPDGETGIEAAEVGRPEERRVGKECVSTFRSRWGP